MSSAAVVLHETGFMTAEGPLGRHDVMLDDDGEGWLLLAPARKPGAPQTILDRHADLDAALRALWAASGRTGPFRVELPCGNRLLRPGKVPVGEVLAAFGYAPVATLTAYARLVPPAGTSAAGAAALLAERLRGRPARPAEAEPIEADDEGAWCCALTLLHPGLFRSVQADGIVRDLLDGADVELIGRGELDLGPGAVPANAAKVLRFAPLVVAA
jgi:hypothetical protein